MKQDMKVFTGIRKDFTKIGQEILKLARSVKCDSAVNIITNMKHESKSGNKKRFIVRSLEEIFATLKEYVTNANSDKDIPDDQFDILIKIAHEMEEIKQQIYSNNEIYYYTEDRNIIVYTEGYSSIMSNIEEIYTLISDLQTAIISPKYGKKEKVISKVTDFLKNAKKKISKKANGKTTSSDTYDPNKKKKIIVQRATGLAAVSIFSIGMYCLTKNMYKITKDPMPNYSDFIGHESKDPVGIESSFIVNPAVTESPVVSEDPNIVESEEIDEIIESEAPVGTDNPIVSKEPDIEEIEDIPTPTIPPVVDDEPIIDKNPIEDQPQTDPAAEELKSAAKEVYGNWSQLGIELTQEEVENVIKGLNGMDSIYTPFEIDSIVLNVLNTAIAPTLVSSYLDEQGNVMVNEQTAQNKLNFTSLILGNKTGKGAVKQMESYLNGCLSDPAHMREYCESAFLEEALSLGEGETIYGFNVNDSSIDPIVRYVWAKLTMGANAFCGKFGEDLYIELDGVIYTQADLNDGEAINAIAIHALNEMGAKAKTISMIN